jgi:hypothetical protein
MDAGGLFPKNEQCNTLESSGRLSVEGLKKNWELLKEHREGYLRHRNSTRRAGVGVSLMIQGTTSH